VYSGVNEKSRSDPVIKIPSFRLMRNAAHRSPKIFSFFAVPPPSPPEASPPMRDRHRQGCKTFDRKDTEYAGSGAAPHRGKDTHDIVGKNY
jgi:hypothetical protein